MSICQYMRGVGRKEGLFAVRVQMRRRKERERERRYATDDSSTRTGLCKTESQCGTDSVHTRSHAYILELKQITGMQGLGHARAHWVLAD